VELNGAPVSAVYALVSDTPAPMRRTDVARNTQGTYFEAAGEEAAAVAPTIVLDEFFGGE
jgi:hypothetical protein